MGEVIATGLGPGDLDRLPTDVRSLLEDPARTVMVRTLQHPAAAQLAGIREVVSCDDLYEGADSFSDVYRQIAARVLGATGDVVYAVPGSPLIAEQSVTELRAAAAVAGRDLHVIPTPSFLDEMFAVLAVDPAQRGFQMLDGRDLPSPMQYHVPLVIFHVDLPLVLADVLDELRRVLPADLDVHVVVDAGSSTMRHEVHPLSEVPLDVAGLRTSLWIDPPDAGYVGAVRAMRRLRRECPWDAEQTHDSLVAFLIEETSEVVGAISNLTPGAPSVEDPDFGAYADLEDELGDLLLQVIFHANLANEAAAFDIEDVAERLREKLVRRHPHVFGDVEVADAAEVIRNWDAIKAGERERSSVLDGIGPMPALQRAIKVQQRVRKLGFDWDRVEPVLADVRGELAELEADIHDPSKAADELGDVLFSVANLARHLAVDPELALQRAVHRFERRFRRMEELGPVEGKSLEELDAMWDEAKRQLEHEEGAQ